MAKAQTQEVAVKKNNQLAVTNLEAEIFESMDYSSSETKDLLIPKILLMQGSSKYVKEDAIAKAGDLVKSTTGEVYGSVREKDYKPVKFVPIFMFKTWVKQELIPSPNGKAKLQWVSTEAVTPMNTDQKWTQEEKDADGSLHQYKLTKNINFYVLLEKDLNNPLAVPHVLTYRSTSAKGGAILENWFAECRAAQMAKIAKDENGHLKVPFAKMFELGGKMDKNDNDESWFVLTTKEAGYTAEEVIPTAFSWYKTVSKSSHNDIDNSDEQQGGETKVPASEKSTKAMF